MHNDNRAARRHFLRRSAALGAGSAALIGCGGGAALTLAGVADPARRLIDADPSDYLAKLAALKPGDTLRLAAGDYGVDAMGRDTAAAPGLPIFGLHGTAAAPIVVTGPDRGPRPRLLGRHTHNTVRIANASHVVVRRLEIDGRGRGGFGVACQGPNHDITIEDNVFVGHGGHQQIVAVSTTGSATWNWVIRRNTIVGAGTGIYLGNSDGTSPFVAGLVEHNLIVDTLGYNLQLKHQLPWSGVPAGMPAGATTTIIRHNVFSKSANSSSGEHARPNLLVGDCPPAGPGSANGVAIYGNFFHGNPGESLFQGEGRIAFHANVMVAGEAALRIRPHNGAVRDVLVFRNTIVASGPAIVVSGGAPGFVQRVMANAVYCPEPPITLAGDAASALANVTGTPADAAAALNAPHAPPGTLDLYPRSGSPLKATRLVLPGIDDLADADRDFDGRPYDAAFRGAYSGQGDHPGWRLALTIKP